VINLDYIIVREFEILPATSGVQSTHRIKVQISTLLKTGGEIHYHLANEFDDFESPSPNYCFLAIGNGKKKEVKCSISNNVFKIAID